jgi:N-methylhydantoinase A
VLGQILLRTPSKGEKGDAFMGKWLIGVDTGGTFTDLVAMDAETGEVKVVKVPSTPQSPSKAVLDALGALGQAVPDFNPSDTVLLTHGTTVATNALVERKGANAGLLITKGFRAIYEVRGGFSLSGIDPFFQKPTMLIPQKHTEEIVERLDSDGKVLIPLDEDLTRQAIRKLKQEGFASAAVCYLFSFLNPVHEERTRQIFGEEYPECRVSLSSRVLPVIREYARLSTAVLDAYVGPIVESYLRDLWQELKERGTQTEQLYVMQSNGGVMRIRVATGYPCQTLLSGPAAGVVFGSSLAQGVGETNIVTFDMGGTSTDISLVKDFQYTETRAGKVAGQDVAIPMIEVRTLGAGGGTIAWVGPDGLLKTGPQSAGADPGPASYGKGGRQATVTDANLVLGYLDPDYFLGGRLKLDKSAAEEAIKRQIATPLGLEVPEAAAGIYRVANVNMEVGLRLSLVEKGFDPRNFTMVAFGGAGPVHAGKLAKALGIPKVIVPLFPGLACALGLLQTDIKHVYLQSRLTSLSKLSIEDMEMNFRALEQKARDEAREEGLDVSQIRLERQLDLRYPYQGYELTIPCHDGELKEADKAVLRGEFDKLHEQVYGISAPGEDVDVVNFRIALTATVPKLEFSESALEEKSAEQALKGRRKAFFGELDAFVETSIYSRHLLRSGNELKGPAIVEQVDSTLVVYPGQVARVDQYGNIIIEDLEAAADPRA